MTDDVDPIWREIEFLHQRLDRLESELEPGESSLPPAASDYRDARVLTHLERGETVSVQTIHDLYDEYTDIRNKKTRRDRVKDLVESGAFESAGSRRWVFVGSDP